MPDNYSDPYRKYPLFRRNLKLEELYEKYKQKYDQKFAQQQFGKKELLWLTAIFLILFSIPFTLDQIQKSQSGLITATVSSKSLSIEAEKTILPAGVLSEESVSASEGKYIRFGPKGMIMGILSCPKIPSNVSKVKYSITIPVSAQYYSWIRLMSSDSDNNSLYLQVDKIILTTDPNCTPVLTGANCLNLK